MEANNMAEPAVKKKWGSETYELEAALETASVEHTIDTLVALPMTSVSGRKENEGEVIPFGKRIQLTEGGSAVTPLVIYNDLIGYKMGRIAEISAIARDEESSAQNYAKPAREITAQLYLQECKRISGYAIAQNKMTADGLTAFVYNERIPFSAVHLVIQEAERIVEKNAAKNEKELFLAEKIDYMLGTVFAHRYAKIDVCQY